MLEEYEKEDTQELRSLYDDECQMRLDLEEENKSLEKENKSLEKENKSLQEDVERLKDMPFEYSRR